MTVFVAGAVVVTVGIYELTPLKRACLGRCRAHVDRRVNAVVAGLRYGANCVGCSAGLMLVLFALGAMSVTWMLVVAGLVFVEVEKVPRVGASLVAPIAVLLVGLGRPSDRWLRRRMAAPHGDTEERRAR